MLVSKTKYPIRNDRQPTYITSHQKTFITTISLPHCLFSLRLIFVEKVPFEMPQKTPQDPQILFNRKREVSHLKTFGVEAHALLDMPNSMQLL